VTRLLNPPRPITLRLNPAGRPCYLQAHPLVGDVQAVQMWLVDQDFSNELHGNADGSGAVRWSRVSPTFQ